MRAVLQRVTEARVVVDGAVTGEIRRGLCVLVGVSAKDTEADARWIAQKCTAARVFTDDNDKMNLSVKDVGGSILAVSQFTLYGDLRTGRRPSFTEAMEPVRAKELFEVFCNEVRGLGVDVQTGVFRAHMDVSLCNSGPVTLLLDSTRSF
jgi:D-tyrosyl-tRNA(Tyr) deacylase